MNIWQLDYKIYLLEYLKPTNVCWVEIFVPVMSSLFPREVRSLLSGTYKSKKYSLNSYILFSMSMLLKEATGRKIISKSPFFSFYKCWVTIIDIIGDASVAQASMFYRQILRKILWMISQWSKQLVMCYSPPEEVKYGVVHKRKLYAFYVINFTVSNNAKLEHKPFGKLTMSIF